MMDLKGPIESEGSNSARTEGCKTDAHSTTRGPSILAPAPYSHDSDGKLRGLSPGVQSQSRSCENIEWCHAVSRCARDNVTLMCNTPGPLRATDHELAVNLKRGQASGRGWSTQRLL